MRYIGIACFLDVSSVYAEYLCDVRRKFCPLNLEDSTEVAMSSEDGVFSAYPVYPGPFTRRVTLDHDHSLW